MPYPLEHMLLTVRGDAWLQTESWQFGLRLSADATITDTLLQSVATAAATPTSTLFTTAGLAVSSNYRLVSLKVAHILPSGLYPATSSPGIHTYAAPVSGPSATITYPQVSCAVTTLTIAPRGLASKGRFYLPGTAISLQTDGRLLATQADAIEAAVVTWIQALNAISGVASAAVFSKVGVGETRSITGVGVGRVLDTMRSRRRSLAELRTPTSV